MDDRELLELAAKAIGIEVRFTESPRGGCIQQIDGDDAGWWNPINSDANALRLAVKLELGIAVMPTYVEVTDGCSIDASEFTHDDPYAATRRAIVRAAAEIGKAMPMSSVDQPKA